MNNRQETPLFIEGVDRHLLPRESDYNRNAILAAWRARLADTDGFAFVLDLDENIFNTADYWVRLTNRLLRLKFGVDPSLLPSPEQVFREGGPSSYYYRHFPDVFPDYESYERIADEWRHRFGPNIYPKKMHPDMDELFDEIQMNGVILGGLTARPDNSAVITATARQMASALNHHDSPSIIHRRVTTPLSHASQEKLTILDDLSQSAAANTALVLVDDSINTARMLSEYNLNAHERQKRPILQILNGLGPLTLPKIESLTELLAANSGIFLMRDWTHLQEVIHEAQTWIAQQSQD